MIRKKLIIPFFFIFLTSCSSVSSLFSPIKTIKCKKIGYADLDFTIVSDKEEIIFNRKTGEQFIYDDFFEELIPLPKEYSSWIKSTVVNGKLKIEKGSDEVWGKAFIKLNNLTGKYQYRDNDPWVLRCKNLKNKTDKIRKM